MLPYSRRSGQCSTFKVGNISCSCKADNLVAISCELGTAGLLGLSLADWLKMKAYGQVQPAKAKSVIQIWLGGGPSHLDTFDPKPEAGDDYCGPLKTPTGNQCRGNPH